MLETVNISYTYPRSAFGIRDISLSINSGECTVLTGVNGSGKTTLGKLIAGLLRQDSGKILLEGKDTSVMSLGQIGRGVGFLFQEPSRQLFAATVQEEITFPLELMGMDSGQAKQTALKLLDRFGMSQYTHRSVARLSRGEKQRLAICALLAMKPKLLILDEPTTGLDSSCRQTLSKIMEELIESSVGILLISHDRSFTQRHANRIITMEGGKVYEKE